MSLRDVNYSGPSGEDSCSGQPCQGLQISLFFLSLSIMPVLTRYLIGSPAKWEVSLTPSPVFPIIKGLRTGDHWSQPSLGLAQQIDCPKNSNELRSPNFPAAAPLAHAVLTWDLRGFNLIPVKFLLGAQRTILIIYHLYAGDGDPKPTNLLLWIKRTP